MRLTFLLASLGVCAALQLHAASQAPKPSPEELAQAEYTKGAGNPKKEARLAAIEAFEAAKPITSISGQLLNLTLTSDPDQEVRLEACRALARMRAHDNTEAKMVVAAFNALPLNDLKTRVAYAKAMEACEFKSDVASALADELSKMRYPEEPKGYRGRPVSDKTKEEVKLKREELKEMLAAFNAIVKSDISESKETPVKVRKWWEENESKFQRADAELQEKDAKADAEKAGKDKAKTVKN
jgi:hypothetical protein